ncbi:MAG: hypothetical protein MUE43_07655 [Serpentinimonas sp.]|jgi:hypothetical protein|nr:hypothetical protein [Serpentinimonas sp.]
MELLFPLLLLAAGFQIVKGREQQRRIQLLGQYLERHQIEKLMETLLTGYLRALGEETDERRAQIFSMLVSAETDLRDQVQRLAEDFSKVWSDHTLVSTLPVALPYADKLVPSATFDMRKALALHAAGIEAVVNNTDGRTEKDKAFTLTAEILLLQHTCHWFCRSRTVATARMLARHQTHYQQLLESVSPQTREAYQRLALR